MDTAQQNRYKVALALERSMGYEFSDSETLEEHRVQDRTKHFSDETCALMASTIGTRYEDTVMHLSFGGMPEDIVTEFIRLAPKCREKERWQLLNYMKDLEFYRSMEPSEALDQFYASSIHELIDSARRYRTSAQTETLPCTKPEELLLINFCERHPQHIDGVCRRIVQGGIVDQHFLDALAETPSLAEGAL